MVKWKRGFLEITAEILEKLAAGPMKKSHMSFRASLDSRAVTKYLEMMIKINLVKKSNKDSSYFIITQKGIEYLKRFQNLLKIIKKE